MLSSKPIYKYIGQRRLNNTYASFNASTLTPLSETILQKQSCGTVPLRAHQSTNIFKFFSQSNQARWLMV